MNLRLVLGAAALATASAHMHAPETTMYPYEMSSFGPIVTRAEPLTTTEKDGTTNFDDVLDNIAESLGYPSIQDLISTLPACSSSGNLIVDLSPYILLGTEASVTQLETCVAACAGQYGACGLDNIDMERGLYLFGCVSQVVQVAVCSYTAPATTTTAAATTTTGAGTTTVAATSAAAVVASTTASTQGSNNAVTTAARVSATPKVTIIAGAGMPEISAALVGAACLAAALWN